jgi:hypothetical protein
LEKALCDKLYKLPPVEGMREFEELLFDDLRIYEGIDMMLNRRTVSQLSSLYRCKNVMMLNRFLKTEEVLG